MGDDWRPEGNRENYIRSYLEADDTADKAKQDAARMQQEIFDVRATNFVLNPEEQKRQQMKAYEAARLGAIADYYDQIDPVALVDSYMMGNPLQVGAQLLPYSSLTFDALLPAGVHVYGSVKDVRMNRAAKEYGVGSVSNIPISAAQVVVEDLPGMTPGSGHAGQGQLCGGGVTGPDAI